MALGDFLKRLLGKEEPPKPPALPPGAPNPTNLPPGAKFHPQTGQPLQRSVPVLPIQPPPIGKTPVQPKPATQPQRKSTTLTLDAGQFAPLSPDDVRRQARGLGSSRFGMWFGRRDRIPPTTDPRTLLIDRAMVGHGLVTPEELADIHKIGDQMEQLRPDLATAHVTADRAVQEDKAVREERKRRKKEEAARRKAEHAAAVAKRKATDIIYLGRGVSRHLADRRASVEKLLAAGLPILATPADVAEALGLTVPRLRWLAFHADAATRTHYVTFTVPKRSGGQRKLSAPHRQMKTAQHWILTNILAKVPLHAAAHGFVPGHSTVTNATPHVDREVIVNTDLTDFFPTITVYRVIGIFRQLGYSPAAATVLGLLCTESPRRTIEYAGKPYHVATGPRGLPQGACTSPALSNLASRRMDSRLSGLASKIGWTYTRYADDLSFSADGDPAQKIGYLLARIRHIAQDEGFAVNEAKTRVLRQNARQLVTGIVVNDRPGIQRKTIRRLRAILHRAKTEGLAAQNRLGHPNFDGWVRGMIAYISMVNPQQGKTLADALEKIKS